MLTVRKISYKHIGESSFIFAAILSCISSHMAPDEGKLAVTTRLRAAALLINRIPSNKFPLLLNRILSRLHSRDAKAFTSDEEAQLQSLFGLSEEETRTVIQAVEYIFEQTAYTGSRGDVLKANLLEAGVDGEHTEVAAMLWDTQSLDVITRLRDRCMGGPRVLTGVDWHVQLTMSESTLGQQGKDPTTLFDFTTSKPTVLKDKQEETFSVEFSHAQLYDFFLDLEKIQEQLDHLS